MLLNAFNKEGIALLFLNDRNKKFSVLEVFFPIALQLKSKSRFSSIVIPRFYYY